MYAAGTSSSALPNHRRPRASHCLLGYALFECLRQRESRIRAESVTILSIPATTVNRFLSTVFLAADRIRRSPMNVMPLNGRPLDRVSIHQDRSARPVRTGAGLSSGRIVGANVRIRL